MATPEENQIQKPFWTLAKTLGLVLIALLVVGVTAFGVLRNLTTPHSAPQACIHGGIYPDCNPATCASGASNPPACVSGTCTNGATNPPSCDNTCPSGAPNYPTCTIFSTETSISCAPVSAYYNSLDMRNGPFGDDCTASVADTTTASGKIVWSNPAQWAGSNSCILTASKCADRISPIRGVQYSALIPLSANYTGDSTHKSSTSQLNITIPSMIYFTYTANVPRDCGCPDYQVTETYFRDSSTGTQYVGFGDYYYFNLPNMKHYDVNINWTSSVNSGSYTCNLDLYQVSDTANAYFQCI